MEHTALYYGQDVRRTGSDLLRPIDLRALAALIADPASELVTLCRSLRSIRRLDREAYRKAKTQLPYFAVSEFRDGIRSTERFVGVSWLVLDLDQCADTREALMDLKNRICSDERIALCFITPSGYGLKCLFRLAETCRDAGHFTGYYRWFAASFATEYGLQQSIDERTCDVTRISFLSHDPQVFVREHSQPLRLPEPEGTDKPVIVQATEEAERGTREPEPAAWNEILKTLNPASPGSRPRREPFVPKMIGYVRPLVEDAVAGQGVRLLDAQPIQYGVKLRFSQELFLAELNVYYGKRGFSVVISPKADTHPTLNQVVHALVYRALFGMDVAVRNLLHEQFVLSQGSTNGQ